MSVKKRKTLERSIGEIAEMMADRTGDNLMCWNDCNMWELCQKVHDGRQQYGDRATCKATMTAWLTGYNVDGRLILKARKEIMNGKE